MEKKINNYNVIPAVLVFVGLPLLFWALGDTPKRTDLKESISIITLLAFSLMLGQFFLARSNSNILRGYKMSKVVKQHKIIGYIFVSVLLVHPFLIVVPRYFESGIDPNDAFLTLITSFNSQGIKLGIISWFLMLILGITSILRNKLPMSYKTWRVFHGILSIVFIILATCHVTDLGRHADTAMSIFMFVLAGGGIMLLFNTYFLKPLKADQSND